MKFLDIKHSMQSLAAKGGASLRKKGRQIAAIVLALTVVQPLNLFAAFALDTFDTPVPELRSSTNDISNAVQIEGYPKARQLINEIYYNDIDRVFSKREIVRMTAVGILNTYGDRNYRPNENTTGHEFLAGVLRFMGRESSVVQRVTEKAGVNATPEQLKGFRNREYFAEARSANLILPNEVLGLEKPITREQAVLFLSRALAAPSTYVQSQVYTFTDWNDVSPKSRPVLESLITSGIVTLGADGKFSPKEPLKRSEMALWLSKAFDRNLEKMDAKIGYGLVIGYKASKTKEGTDTIESVKINLKGIDGTMTDLNTRHRSSGEYRDFVVYKNGIISNGGYLAVGNEIEYITVGDTLRYAGTIPNGQVLSELAPKPDVYSLTHYGTIVDTKKQEEVKDGKSFTKEIYRVVDVGGDTFDIVVYEDRFTGVRDDIVTFKDGKVGGVAMLQKKDQIEYVTNEKGTVSYIKITDHRTKTVAGTVNKIEPIKDDAPAYITVFGYDDQLYRAKIAPYSAMTINQREAKLEEFVYGMPVVIKLTNETVVVMEGESQGSEPGYIPSFGKMRMGVVQKKDKQALDVLLPNGVKEKVGYDSKTQWFKNGTPTTPQALKVGDKIKAYYDGISDKNSVRIEIEAKEVLFDRIYKGKLENIIPQSGELHLVGSDGVSSPEYIQNEKWNSTDEYSLDLAIDPSCEIYIDDEKLSPENLERMYTGYQIYAVTRQVFGKETAVKISVKTGAEMLYSSSVHKVDHTKGQFDLLTRENFNMTKATIVIKDGMLVPSELLKARDSVLVASESPRGGYEKNALFVRVTTAHDAIFDSVRIGAVESVNPSTMTFANHTKFTNNKLDVVRQSTSGQYKFYTGSRIVDVTDAENHKTISPQQFFHDKYARTENEVKLSGTNPIGLKYKRYYAFAVVNPADNTIIAMNLRHKGLMPWNMIDDRLKKEDEIVKELQNTFVDAVITRGIVTGKDDTWDRLELTDAHDFTNYTARWTATGTNIFVKHQDAIVIKNNRPVGIDQVKVGDYIYIMRIKGDALVIFVE